MLNKAIRFFLENKLVTIILLLIFVLWGVVSSPFSENNYILPSDPVSVDAIPDIGENQKIVFSKWQGRSPQDIEDQVTYPLTTALLGIPGVKTVRSNSMFGFSSIYIIFNDDVEFYWSRSRVLEKLSSLPPSLLPESVKPQLGPDATGLGQIFWYTIEGRDSLDNPTGGWDLQELRAVQDFQVKYALSSVSGVSEVASIGGYIKEYQVDIKPEAMQAYGVNIQMIMQAVKNSNLDIGARTIEINQVEYFIRGIGYIKNLKDLEESVVAENNNTPVRIKDVATVSFGPAERRGVLDKGGAEVVGGVVVARFGANPMEVINGVKKKISELSAGIPQKKLASGKTSKLKIIPFYDRSILIKETLGTLKEALTLEIVITILVVLIMVMNLRASILISSLIPIAVFMTFIAMKNFGVDANIVALSGIAIAIGTIVDVGIVLSENIITHLKTATNQKKIDTIYNAVKEVAPAVITAVLTTIVSFIPVFAMEAAEGKLFQPLAFTKTFVLLSTLIVAITILPALAHSLFSIRILQKQVRLVLNISLLIVGLFTSFYYSLWVGVILIILGIINILEYYLPKQKQVFSFLNLGVISLSITYLLASEWMPLGVSNSTFSNYIFVIISIVLLLSLFLVFIKYYNKILSWALSHKLIFLAIPSSLVLFSLIIWLSWTSIFGFIAKGIDITGYDIRTTKAWSFMHHSFPGTGKEFMPALDEGSFLLMPTSMPHAGIEENKRVLKQLDMVVSSIPEVESVVGKLGRIDSPLDPAPISMYENLINYKSEYKTNASGTRERFKVDNDNNYIRDSLNQLIPDKNGEYYRQWRPEVKSPDDIWNLIVSATNLPGVTSAPKLQPIETRLVMLQTGMRAPIGIKILGNNLDTIQQFSLQLEKVLKELPCVNSASVFADRIVGKPYLEIHIDRKKIARFGLTVAAIQKHISVSIGGKTLGSTVEGRERYPIRVRYPREFRNNPEMLGQILIPTQKGNSIPLNELANFEYVQGPQAIKSENTFLLGYVIFDKAKGHSEVEVVEKAQEYINNKIEKNELRIPTGVSYIFTGNYENQVRSEKRLRLVIPIVLIIIFLILYFQFKKVSTSLLVFSGILVAFSGSFILIWLYGQDWFMNFSILEINFRELFRMKPIFMSVAVWVGFIALFGIATDDGVLMASYLEDTFRTQKPKTKYEIRKAVLQAGSRRIRPCLMTTATTILALLPVLTSTGRGADIMIPMAIPVVGGMAIELLTLFVIPILYSALQERKVRKHNRL